MAIIGSIVIGMIAQTDRFLTPLMKAQKALGSFSAGFGKFLAGPVGRLESALSSVGHTIAGAFENIDKTGDAADRIGTTTAALVELRYAAKLTGTETESMDNAMLKFSANLGEAVSSDITPTAKALKSIGLDPKQLAAADITEAIAQVSDAMAGMGNEAQRNAMLKELFGKGGIQIANTMKAGGAEIRRLSADVHGFGGAVSESQRQSVAVMMDSVDKAGAALEGLGTQIAVGVSPYIDAAINEFMGLASQGQGAGEAVTGAMDWIVRRMADVADFIQGARNVFLTLEYVASKAFVAIMDGAATLARGLDKILESTTGYTTGIGATLSDMAEGFKATSQTFQESIYKTLGDESWGDRFKKTADVAIAKSRQMASEAVKANKKTVEAVKTLTITQENSDKAATKALADWAARAKSIFDEVQTPLEKYQDKVEDIKSAFAGGAISMETARRALGKAGAEAVGEGPKFAGALDAGSKEARSAILQAISGRGGAQDMVAKNTADAVTYLKRIAEQQRLQALSPPIPTEELAMF